MALRHHTLTKPSYIDITYHCFTSHCHGILKYLADTHGQYEMNKHRFHMSSRVSDEWDVHLLPRVEMYRHALQV